MTIPAKVQLAGDGTGGHVEIDGHEIADQAARLVVVAIPGKAPKLTVSLVQGLSLEAACDIALATSTRAALVALGWTPPQETHQ